jgi:hypothetical protein
LHGFAVSGQKEQSGFSPCCVFVVVVSAVFAEPAFCGCAAVPTIKTDSKSTDNSLPWRGGGEIATVKNGEVAMVKTTTPAGCSRVRGRCVEKFR